MSVDDWVKIIGAISPYWTALVGLAGAALGAWVMHKNQVQSRKLEERKWLLDRKLKLKEEAITNYVTCTVRDSRQLMPLLRRIDRTFQNDVSDEVERALEIVTRWSVGSRMATLFLKSDKESAFRKNGYALNDLLTVLSGYQPTTDWKVSLEKAAINVRATYPSAEEMQELIDAQATDNGV